MFTFNECCCCLDARRYLLEVALRRRSGYLGLRLSGVSAILVLLKIPFSFNNIFVIICFFFFFFEFLFYYTPRSTHSLVRWCEVCYFRSRHAWCFCHCLVRLRKSHDGLRGGRRRSTGPSVVQDDDAVFAIVTSRLIGRCRSIWLRIDWKKLDVGFQKFSSPRCDNLLFLLFCRITLTIRGVLCFFLLSVQYIRRLERDNETIFAPLLYEKWNYMIFKRFNFSN